MFGKRIAVGAAVAASGFLFLVGPAWADPLPGVGCSQPCPPPGDVLPNSEVRTGAQASAETVSAAPAAAEAATAVAPAVATAPRSTSGALPLTGADVAELTGIGVAALGAGLVLRRRSRVRA